MIIVLKTIQIKILACMEIGNHICHINRISDLCCCGVISICDLCIFVVFFVVTVVLVGSCKLGFCLRQNLIIRNFGLFCLRQRLISCTCALYLSFICCCDRSACQCFDLPDHRLYLCRIIPGRCCSRCRCCGWFRCCSRCRCRCRFRCRRWCRCRCRLRCCSRCRCCGWLRCCSRCRRRCFRWFRCSSWFRFRCSSYFRLRRSCRHRICRNFRFTYLTPVSRNTFLSNNIICFLGGFYSGWNCQYHS